MLDASSHGHVAPKTKSINVEANLLAQRLEERRLIRAELKKRLLTAGAALLIVLIGFPPVYRFQAAQAQAYKRLSDQDKLLAGKLASVEKQEDSLKPALEDQKLSDGIKTHNNEVLGQLLLFLNNVNPRVSLTSVSVNIKDSEININTSGRGTSYEAAAKFIADSAKGPNSKGTILSTMGADSTVGPDGVSFNFMKKIKVIHD